MFRAMFLPVIRSTWLYLQYLVVFTKVAAGWCHGWVETASSFNSSKTPAGNNVGEYYQILEIQSSAPDDGRKHLPKHVELTRNYKLTRIVATASGFNSFKTPTSNNVGEYYQILEIQSNAPDDGRKHRPKHVELTRNYKLTRIVATASGFNSFKTPAGNNVGEYYQILEIQSSAPDDGRKHRPIHVELNRNNKLTRIVATVSSFNSFRTPAGKKLGWILPEAVNTVKCSWW